MKDEDGYYYIDENGKKQRNDIQDYDDIIETGDEEELLNNETMKTYIFVDGNSSATMTISAGTKEDAKEELSDVVRYPDEWRLDETQTE